MKAVLANFAIVTLGVAQGILLALWMLGVDLHPARVFAPTWVPAAAFTLGVLAFLPGSIRRAIARRKTR